MNAERRRFYARSGDQRSQQFRLRSHDANLVVCDLDTLRQRAQVVAAVAAIVEPYAFTLVPWRPVIDRQLGREVMGVVQGGSVSWQLGRQRGISL